LALVVFPVAEEEEEEEEEDSLVVDVIRGFRFSDDGATKKINQDILSSILT
jgi:hypothetical protein